MILKSEGLQEKHRAATWNWTASQHLLQGIAKQSKPE
jgi:hypothetical protein